MAKTIEQLDAGVCKDDALNSDSGNVGEDVRRGCDPPRLGTGQPGHHGNAGGGLKRISRELGFRD